MSGGFHTTGCDLTFLGLLHRYGVLLVILRGGGRLADFGSAALLPQMLGHVVDVLAVFGGSVVFDVVNANRATFDLTAQTNSQRSTLTGTFKVLKSIEQPASASQTADSLRTLTPASHVEYLQTHT